MHCIYICRHACVYVRTYVLFMLCYLLDMRKTSFSHLSPPLSLSCLDQICVHSFFVRWIDDIGMAWHGQGRVPLETSEQRANEEEVVQKTTTQMYRAPEMVDLYLERELTEKVDVWVSCLESFGGG